MVFLIWLPDYFKKTRDLDLKAMGLPLVVIYAIVTVLSTAGGWAAKALVERGWRITRTRRTSFLIFACCVLPVALAPKLSMWAAEGLIGLVGAAHQAWSATLFTTVSDIFPKRAVASVVGLSGLCSSLVGMAFPVISGRVLDTLGAAGYGVLFGYCSLAYLIAFGINRALCPIFEPIRIRD